MTVVVLAVGGNDPTGLAGLAADVRAGAAAGVHVATAVSALTVQNGRGVFRVEPVSAELLGAQVRAALEDLPVQAVKIGLVADGRSLDAVMAALNGRNLRVVLDPVLAATAGGRLSGIGISDLARAVRGREVLLTPNLDEAAELLGGGRIEGLEEMKRAASALAQRTGCAVLLKGGHLEEGGSVTDVLCCGRIVSVFSSHRVPVQARGTGCALATLIAAGLARGRDPEDAVRIARRIMAKALERIMEGVVAGIPGVLPLVSEGGRA